MSENTTPTAAPEWLTQRPWPRAAMKRAAVVGLLDLMRGASDFRVQAAACLDEHWDTVKEVRPAEASSIRSDIALIVGPYMLARMAVRAAR